MNAAIVSLATLVFIGLGAALVRSLLVIAQPDEWLLCIRDGALVRAGIGITLWRRPGDVVARFTSTTQRVGFASETLSADRLEVAVEGFILWSVSPEGDSPFRAFRKLGLANLNAPPPDLRSRKHLLTSAQHRAFQKLLGAAVQRLTAAMPLEQLLAKQDELVERLRHELLPFAADMGIALDQIEILRVRPAAPELLRQMAVATEEGLRQHAAEIQAAVRREQLARDKALRLSELEHQREVALRAEEHARAAALAEEAKQLEVARAVMERQELELSRRLERMRREAEAERDAARARASAEEEKSQAVREHELARLVAEQLGEALKQLPLKEASWVSVGADSPASGLAALLAAGRELVAPRR